MVALKCWAAGCGGQQQRDPMGTASDQYDRLQVRAALEEELLRSVAGVASATAAAAEAEARRAA